MPTEILESADQKLLFSLGIGFDVSFDLAMSKKGFKVVAVDPLFECIEFAKRELAGAPVVFFENVAISNFNGVEVFFPPKNVKHDSWSSINIQKTSFIDSTEFPVLSLESLTSKYISSEPGTLVYLKMDIEGAEIKIIPEISSSKTRFDFVGIELDFLSLIPFLEVRQRARSIRLARKFLHGLQIAGYHLVHTENFNFFWEFRESSYISGKESRSIKV